MNALEIMAEIEAQVAINKAEKAAEAEKKIEVMEMIDAALDAALVGESELIEEVSAAVSEPVDVEAEHCKGFHSHIEAVSEPETTEDVVVDHELMNKLCNGFRGKNDHATMTRVFTELMTKKPESVHSARKVMAATIGVKSLPARFVKKVLKKLEENYQICDLGSMIVWGD